MITETQLTRLYPSFLARIKARSRRRVATLRREWNVVRSTDEMGPAVTHEDIDRILNRGFDERGASDPVDDDGVRVADAAFMQDPAWARMADEFALTRHEVDLLTLTLGIYVEPDIGRVYGYLEDEPSSSHPTLTLAASVFDWTQIPAIGPTNSLVWWALARPIEGPTGAWTPATQWVAEPAIGSWMLGGPAIDPEFGSGVSILDAKTVVLGCVHPEARDQVLDFVASVTGSPSVSAVAVELIGPPGSGRRTLAAQLAARCNLNLLVVDTAQVFSPDIPLALARERLRRCMRAARLENAAVCWHVDGELEAAIWDALPGAPALSFFASERPVLSGSQPGFAHVGVEIRHLTQAATNELWKEVAHAPLPEDLQGWALTPAQLRSAADAEPAGPAAMVDACRRTVRSDREELLGPLACPYTWDDIVLEGSTLCHLREFEAQARLRWEVLDGWGFRRLTPLNLGISAMFAGPSGTGKTMAAQVIAGALGMQLLKIDLAGVVNKYIGETEKRLKRVFDACENVNGVLLFDEADALFGRRTQVKEAHDRFANIEIDYLLQRMERFNGIAILATNRRGDIDQAFMRRLRFVIDFLPPGPRERLALWRIALPATLPDGTKLLAGVDFDFLAQRLLLTGAGIKSAAIAAAFLAKHDSSAITMDHILRAARRELAKTGTELRLEALSE